VFICTFSLTNSEITSSVKSGFYDLHVWRTFVTCAYLPCHENVVLIGHLSVFDRRDGVTSTEPLYSAPVLARVSSPCASSSCWLLKDFAPWSYIFLLYFMLKLASSALGHNILAVAVRVHVVTLIGLDLCLNDFSASVQLIYIEMIWMPEFGWYTMKWLECQRSLDICWNDWNASVRLIWVEMIGMPAFGWYMLKWFNASVRLIYVEMIGMFGIVWDLNM
jgi:hypothetical protein